MLGLGGRGGSAYNPRSALGFVWGFDKVEIVVKVSVSEKDDLVLPAESGRSIACSDGSKRAANAQVGIKAEIVFMGDLQVPVPFSDLLFEKENSRLAT